MNLMIFKKNPIFDGEMGVAATLSPEKLGPQDQKVGPMVGPFGSTRYLKKMFSKI